MELNLHKTVKVCDFVPLGKTNDNVFCINRRYYSLARE